MSVPDYRPLVIENRQADDERRPLLENTHPPRGTIESWSAFEKVAALACIVLLVTGVSIGVYLLARQNVWYPSEFELILRNDWHALKPNGTLTRLTHPVLRVLLLETNTSSCSNTRECKQYIRAMQWDHFQYEEEDIKYNFVVGGDGKIYEGRGWKYASPLANSDQLAVIAFLGKFEEEGPTNQQINALKSFLDYSVSKKYLTGCYEIIVRYSPKRYLIDVAQEISDSMKQNENIKCYF